MKKNLKISINPKHILILFSVTSIILFALHLFGIAGGLIDGKPTHHNFYRFHLGVEASIPTWYASTLLFLGGILFIAISHMCKIEKLRYVKQWFFLGVVFVFLSIDEASMVYEKYPEWLGSLLGPEGSMIATRWEVYGVALVTALTIIYLKFFIDLPPRTKMLLISSALLFIGGALGVELLQGYYGQNKGVDSYGYHLISGVEETLETLGSGLLVYTLLDYWRRNLSRVSIGVRQPTVSKK